MDTIEETSLETPLETPLETSLETKLETSLETTLETTLETPLKTVATVVDFTLPKLESILEVKQTETINNTEIVPVSELTVKVEVKPENVLIDCVEYLYNHLKSIHSEKITPANVVLLAMETIQLVEKYKELTGHQKKTMVISVVKKLVNTQFDTEEDKRAMNLIIDLTLPTVVDNLVNAINGNIKFDKEKAKSFFKKYLCCFCN